MKGLPKAALLTVNGLLHCAEILSLSCIMILSYTNNRCKTIFFFILWQLTIHASPSHKKMMANTDCILSFRGGLSEALTKSNILFSFVLKYMLFFEDTFTKDDTTRMLKSIYQNKIYYPGNR